MPINPIRAALDELEAAGEAFSGRRIGRRLRIEEGLVYTPQSVVSVDEARTMIRQAIREYLALEHPKHMLLIKAPPGVGKTTIAVEMAEAYAGAGKRVFYAGPRRDFFQDIRDASNRPAWWYDWISRSLAQAEDLPALCRYYGEIEQWMQRGYQAIDFCSNPKICGWAFIQDGCPWHAQKRQLEPIIFGQHAHIALGHPMMEQIALIIGDENPLDAFMHNWEVPGDKIVPEGISFEEPITELLYALSGMAAKKGVTEGETLLKGLGGAARVLEICEEYTVEAAEAAAPNLRSAGDVDAAPYFHIFTLAAMLVDEAKLALAGKPYAHRVYVERGADEEKGSLHLLRRRPITAHAHGKHVVWLDGTGDPHIYGTLFGRAVDVVTVDVALQGRVFQVVDRTNGKGSLVKDGKPTAKAGQLKQQIEHIIRSQGYREPAVIGFEALEGEIPGVATAHFYGARGTNRFETCDAIIIAGTPQPRKLELDKQARMLYDAKQHPAPFDTTWSDRNRTYRYVGPDGTHYSYPVGGCWADADLQALLWQKREAEIIQDAHRGRPVTRAVDIWLLTNIPLDELPPSELISVQQLFGAPDGVDPYRWGDVLALADLFFEEGEPLGAPDIVDVLKVSRKVATHYWERLLETQPERWTVDRVAYAKNAGRPRRILRPLNTSRNKFSLNT
jgi:DNA polymerase III delta prime subunit